MITKKKYNKALKIINDYKTQISNKNINDFTCCICEKNKIIRDNNLSSLIDPLEQHKCVWNGGTVEKINFGFGSNHDTQTFFIGVCDECINNLKQKKLIINFKDLKNKLNEK